MRKYNYVIFGSSWDLYKHSYADIIGLEDVVYISDMLFKSNIIRHENGDTNHKPFTVMADKDPPSPLREDES